MKRVCIIGAGLAGSYLAVLLAQQGYAVEVYERRPRRYLEANTSGVSLPLSARGILALSMAGVLQDVMPHTQRMYGKRMHYQDAATYIGYDEDGTRGYSGGSTVAKTGVVCTISRDTLNHILIEAAIAHSHVCVHFGVEFDSLKAQENDENILTPIFTPHVKSGQFDFIVGVDNSSAKITDALHKLGLSAGSAKQHASYVCKEITIPWQAKDAHPPALELWPRKACLLMGFPRKSLKGLYGTLFMSTEQQDFSRLNNPKAMLRFLHDEFTDVDFSFDDAAVLSRQPWDIAANRATGVWHYKNVMLLGDAAYTLLPFLGQRLDCALEDCRLFVEALVQHAGKHEAAFTHFFSHRQADIESVCHLSARSGADMMHEYHRPEYLVRTKFEYALSRRYPDLYVPYYHLVTFGLIPHQHVALIKQWQDELMAACDLAAFVTHRGERGIDLALNQTAFTLYRTRIQKKLMLMNAGVSEQAIWQQFA